MRSALACTMAEPYGPVTGNVVDSDRPPWLTPRVMLYHGPGTRGVPRRPVNSSRCDAASSATLQESHSTVHHKAPFSATQHSYTLYTTIQLRALQYRSAQYHTVQHRTVQYSTAMHGSSHGTSGVWRRPVFSLCSLRCGVSFSWGPLQPGPGAGLQVRMALPPLW